jgi:DNA polymerase-3 subunit gamma/tau
MSYVVTARKWRPQKFSEVVGQEHITQTIKNAIVNSRIAHAFIFAGPRGVGKTTTARILAKSLNCLNPKDGEPCNECELCKAFANSQSLDIIEIDGASNRRIEEVRQLRESVKYAPTKGNFKVYIVDEVHMLTNESFNAFLKTLEEPPEHTIFIFATTDIHKVPLTIISRCQRFDFRRIEINDIKNHLIKIAEAENINIDDQSLTVIAKKADGALRDAQSLFDQVISFCGNEIDIKVVSEMLNMIDEEIYFELSDSILDKKFSSAFDVTQKIYSNGWNFIDFIDGLIEHFRNILTVVIRKDTKLIEWSDVFSERYQAYANRFSEGDMLRILSFLNKTAYELKNTQNQKLKIEIALSHIIGLERSETLSNLLKNIESGTISNLKIDTTKSEAEEKKKSELETKAESPQNTELADSSIITAPSTVKTDISLIKIKNLWQKYCDEIQKEKLLLGGSLSSCKPVEITKDELTIATDSSEYLKTLKKSQKYLIEKATEIFGSKLNIEIILSEEITSSKKENFSAIKSNNDESPIIKAIFEKLDGKEIS